jgi:hypothetical protein
MGEIIFNGIVGGLMIFFLLGSRAIEDLGRGDPIGPAGFPVLMASMGVILLVVLSVDGYRKRGDRGASEKERSLSSAALATLLLLTLYVPALSVLGFIVSSFLLLSVLVFIFGCPSIRSSLFVGLVGTAIAVLLFGRILHVALPRGMGLLRVLSYHVY